MLLKVAMIKFIMYVKSKYAYINKKEHPVEQQAATAEIWAHATRPVRHCRATPATFHPSLAALTHPASFLPRRRHRLMLNVYMVLCCNIYLPAHVRD